MNFKKRPLGIWIITAFYFLSAYTLLRSYLLISNGLVPMNDAQRSYFSSISAVNWVIPIISGIVVLVAAASLFLLRRVSLTLFVIGFCLSLLSTLFEALTTNWVKAMASTGNGGGLIGVAVGWIIQIIVLLYINNLVKKKILT
jgi:hypothetical protein